MSNKLVTPERVELETYYNTVKSISKTAKYYETSNPTVRKWLLKYDIPIYTQREANLADIESKQVPIPNREMLSKDYSLLSIHDLSRKYHVTGNTIRKWLSKYNIPRIDDSARIRNAKKRKFDARFSQISKNRMEADILLGYGIAALAKKYTCSVGTIKKLLNEYELGELRW